MARYTSQGWWCGMCSTQNSPSNSTCCSCHSRRFEKNAQVHASERAVVYYNPATGEHRTPPRADVSMPEVYATQGFERREIMNMGQWEKESGVVHEPSNYHPGNEPDPLKPEKPLKIEHKPELIRELVQEVRSALDDSPWTGLDKLGANM